jgi:hypothetical protein
MRGMENILKAIGLDPAELQRNMEGMISGTVDVIAKRFDAFEVQLVEINQKLDRIEERLETVPTNQLLVETVPANQVLERLNNADTFVQLLNKQLS